MRRHLKHKRSLLFLLVFFIVSGPIWVVSSEPDKGMHARPRIRAKTREHKWAVIIGINEYKDPVIVDLKYAVADAQGIYELLIHKQYGGFEAKKVRLLTRE